MRNICEVDIALLLCAVFFATMFIRLLFAYNKMCDLQVKAVREKQSAERRLVAICKLRGLNKEDFE